VRGGLGLTFVTTETQRHREEKDGKLKEKKGSNVSKSLMNSFFEVLEIFASDFEFPALFPGLFD